MRILYLDPGFGVSERIDIQSASPPRCNLWRRPLSMLLAGLWRCRGAVEKSRRFWHPGPCCARRSVLLSSGVRALPTFRAGIDRMRGRLVRVCVFHTLKHRLVRLPLATLRHPNPAHSSAIKVTSHCCTKTAAPAAPYATNSRRACAPSRTRGPRHTPRGQHRGPRRCALTAAPAPIVRCSLPPLPS